MIFFFFTASCLGNLEQAFTLSPPLQYNRLVPQSW